jgi:XRE family transcriptional regulator, regulator of sulfur utilization
MSGRAAPLPPPGEPKVRIGGRLKAERQRRGLSLRDLAERTGFSASFLSQLELDQASPSLASLAKLAQTLGLSLGHLLSDAVPGADATVIRAEEHGRLRSEWSKATVCSLLPSRSDERLSIVLVELEPGGTSGDPGNLLGREFAYCLRGSLALRLGETDHRLSAGDSVLYDASRAPRWTALGRARAQFLLMSLRIL